MSRHEGSVSVRKVIETAFAAVTAVAILVSVGAATAAMCFPGPLMA